MLLVCPRCWQRFEAPDLRRNSLRHRRIACPACGKLIDKQYHKRLRERDEKESIPTPKGEKIGCKTQLFLLEVASFLSAGGWFSSSQLIRAHLFGVAANMRSLLHHGIVERETLKHYTLTPFGHAVLARAREHYAPPTNPSKPTLPGDSHGMAEGTHI